MTWNDRLRSAREAKGLNKAEFARAVGVSGATVTDWESGKIKRIDGNHLIRVCDVLDITPHELMTGKRSRHLAAQPGQVSESAPTYQPEKFHVVARLLQHLTAAQQVDLIQEMDKLASQNKEVIKELSNKPQD